MGMGEEEQPEELPLDYRFIPPKKTTGLVAIVEKSPVPESLIVWEDVHRVPEVVAELEMEEVMYATAEVTFLRYFDMKDPRAMMQYAGSEVVISEDTADFCSLPSTWSESSDGSSESPKLAQGAVQKHIDNISSTRGSFLLALSEKGYPLTPEQKAIAMEHLYGQENGLAAFIDDDLFEEEEDEDMDMEIPGFEMKNYSPLMHTHRPEPMDDYAGAERWSILVPFDSIYHYMAELAEAGCAVIKLPFDEYEEEFDEAELFHSYITESGEGIDTDYDIALEKRIFADKSLADPNHWELIFTDTIDTAYLAVEQFLQGNYDLDNVAKHVIQEIEHCPLQRFDAMRALSTVFSFDAEKLSNMYDELYDSGKTNQGDLVSSNMYDYVYESVESDLTAFAQLHQTQNSD